MSDTCPIVPGGCYNESARLFEWSEVNEDASAQKLSATLGTVHEGAALLHRDRIHAERQSSRLPTGAYTWAAASPSAVIHGDRDCLRWVGEFFSCSAGWEFLSRESKFQPIPILCSFPKRNLCVSRCLLFSVLKVVGRKLCFSFLARENRDVRIYGILGEPPVLLHIIGIKNVH